MIHNDHLGTPQKLTDQSQVVVWEADVNPFGETTITTNTITNNLRFPGQYYDDETNLHHNGYRTYDPSIGRYIQSDPIGLSGGINTYSYVGSNPLNLTDPNGLAVQGLALCIINPGACIAAGKAASATATALLGILGIAMLSDAIDSDDARSEAETKDKSCECIETVYRVYGGAATMNGEFWTPIDPRSVSNYRQVAGLPNSNSGEFLAIGCITEDTEVIRGSAASFDGNIGGLLEYQIPNRDVIIQSTQKLNPPL